MSRPSALKKRRSRRPYERVAVRRSFDKVVQMPPPSTSNVTTEEENDRTLLPSSEIEQQVNKFSDDSTEAPSIGKEQETESEYVKTWAALTDKHILSAKKGLPFSIIIFVMGWIFIQDNKAGNLENWTDMLWTCMKCVVVLVSYFIFSIFNNICRWIKSKF